MQKKQRYNSQEALKLAGKLALIADLVAKSNVRNISARVEEMEKALDEYNNYILEWSTSGEK